jgi:hypothetical protein
LFPIHLTGTMPPVEAVCSVHDAPAVITGDHPHRQGQSAKSVATLNYPVTRATEGLSSTNKRATHQEADTRLTLSRPETSPQAKSLCDALEGPAYLRALGAVQPLIDDCIRIDCISSQHAAASMAPSR